MDFAVELKTELLIKKNLLPKKVRKYSLWMYRFNQTLEGFTQMGLMTDDLDEAQKQLTAIYSEPVIELHKLTAINHHLIQQAQNHG